jgi:hypothetical protein
MQEYLEAQFEGQDNPEYVTERALWLEAMMARSGKLLADAEYHRDKFLSSEILSIIESIVKGTNTPASTVNKLVDSIAKDYNHSVKWAERVNRTCTHSHQFCITLLSKLKEEAKMAGFSKNY